MLNKLWQQWLFIVDNHKLFQNQFLYFQNKRLAFALKKGDVDIAQECLHLGADVNYMEPPQGEYMVSSVLIFNCLSWVSLSFVLIIFLQK